MSSSDKQVRVFISSTFRDMHAERDHLVTVVFPELRERVEGLGLEFFDVDLRWGVPEKDANGETANSWDYCKKWIDRVEPFFVSLLGQRYGYVPKPGEIRDETDRQAFEGLSITEMEIRHAVLAGRLKRRSFFYLRGERVPDDAPAETRKVFVEDDDKVERLKTQIKSGSRPVREYPCRWTGNGFADVERFGQMVLEDLWSGVLRDERYVSKEHWRQALGGEPDSDPLYTDDTKPVHPDLAEKLVALAKPAPVSPLDAERQQMEAFAESRLRWFQGRTKELKQLTEFIESTDENAPRLAVVAAVPGQGKSALLAKLWQEIRPATLTGPDGHPLPSDGRGAGGEGHFIIAHFVGATERSASSHALVQRLLDELDRSGIQWPAEEQKEGEEPKRDFNSLCKRLAHRLHDYAGERRIVILLDALNQLTDGHNLIWLPGRLGPSVRIVVSRVDTTLTRPAGHPLPSTGRGAGGEGQSPEHLVLGSLERWKDSSLRVPLGPLNEGDVREIVVRYLEEYCKELDERHVAALCKVPQASNPLYLLVMLGELRTLGGDDMNQHVPRLIAELPVIHPDTVSLFRWVLQRLEVFGADAVRWWCLYLAYGRVGMASQELAELLVRKLGENGNAAALRIERGLRRHLQRRGGQLDFFHSQLRQAVFDQYGSQAEVAIIHDEMADYFTACAKGTDPQKEWETESTRGFAECVFHRARAGQYKQAAGLLTSFPFLLHKLRVGLLEGVFEDYEMVLREGPAEVKKRLEIWNDFFRQKGHILRRGNDDWPAHKILLQLAVEHADDSPFTIGAEQWLAEGRCDWLWMGRVGRPQRFQKNPCLAVLEGHANSVNGALVLSDGRLLSWSQDKTLRVWDSRTGVCLAILTGHTDWVSGALELTGGRLVSWSQDKTLRLWDIKSGQCLVTFEGHKKGVTGAFVMADGRLLSWSDVWSSEPYFFEAPHSDFELRIWNRHTGTCLAVLQGHTKVIHGALELGDNRLVSWSQDKTLRLWNCRTGVCLAILTGHTDWVSGALELTGGRLVSWSQDKTLRVWDSRTGVCLAILTGHTDWVSGALELTGGRLVSWSQDKTLRVWDIKSGQCIRSCKGHSSWVDGILLIAGERILSWSRDHSFRLWNLRTGQEQIVYEGHSSPVFGLLTTAEGNVLSWSGDATLRLWNRESGKCLMVLRGHSTSVHGARLLDDGRILSWSDDATLRVWESQVGQPLSQVEGDWSWIRTVQGATVLANDRILSWSCDGTMCVWESRSGQCLKILEGHTELVNGVLQMRSGRILSWSGDHTLRLWDADSGICLNTLLGHTNSVNGTLELEGGGILSWSSDGTLCLWNADSGIYDRKLVGHTDQINGALELARSRILSWSGDGSLRLWETESGRCLKTLHGHTSSISGVKLLASGRILTWSCDSTLRLWERQCGQCVSVFEGHTDSVMGALEMEGGRILSWSCDGTLRLWHEESGRCFRVLSGHKGIVLGAEMVGYHALSWSFGSIRMWDTRTGQCVCNAPRHQDSAIPRDWLYVRARHELPTSVSGHFWIKTSTRITQLLHRDIRHPISIWAADATMSDRCLMQCGTAVVTPAGGQLFFLKLYHGNRRVSLAEAETILRDTLKSKR